MISVTGVDVFCRTDWFEYFRKCRSPCMFMYNSVYEFAQTGVQNKKHPVRGSCAVRMPLLREVRVEWPD